MPRKIRTVLLGLAFLVFFAWVLHTSVGHRSTRERCESGRELFSLSHGIGTHSSYVALDFRVRDP